MARLGEALRTERERLGLTIEQAAEETRIREKFLRALENGDYQTLPGAVYTKGFLRNYAEYLKLDPDALIQQFQSERGTPDAPRSFEPMRPIMRRAVILTPAVLVPVAVLAAVTLFLAYLYYQFTTFAVLPRLEIDEPAGDAIVQVAEYTVRGRTVPDGRLTIRVLPGGDAIPDVRAAPDGAFSARVPLKPGANHVDVQVFDATGKVNQASRPIRVGGGEPVPWRGRDRPRPADERGHVHEHPGAGRRARAGRGGRHREREALHRLGGRPIRRVHQRPGGRADDPHRRPAADGSGDRGVTERDRGLHDGGRHRADPRHRVLARGHRRWSGRPGDRTHLRAGAGRHVQRPAGDAPRG